MFLAPLIPALISLAPSIVKAFGSNLQDEAVKTVKNATGIDITGPIEDVKAQLVGLSPQQQEALKSADNDFRIKYFEQVNIALQTIAGEESNVRNMQNDKINGMRTEYLRSNYVLLFGSIVGAFYLFARGDVSGGEGALIGGIVQGLLQKYGTIGDFLMGGSARMMNFVSKSMDKKS